ncbi:MAG: hypothetical protein LBK47_05150 [Prevotellaceae bacterium]|nr:hypothetical protein [Prevotellaceae bacterium]
MEMEQATSNKINEIVAMQSNMLALLSSIIHIMTTLIADKEELTQRHIQLLDKKKQQQQCSKP